MAAVKQAASALVGQLLRASAEIVMAIGLHHRCVDFAADTQAQHAATERENAKTKGVGKHRPSGQR